MDTNWKTDFTCSPAYHYYGIMIKCWNKRRNWKVCLHTLQVNMQRICLESSLMRPTPSPSGSTPCRSVWTDSPSASPSWTPKKRSVSTHTKSRATKREFYIKYKQRMNLRVSGVIKSPHTCSFLLMAAIEMSVVCELTQFSWANS